MIKVLKETPITFHGIDAMEVLVENWDLGDTYSCDMCAYRDYIPVNDLGATCMDVHGCTKNALAYFIIKPLE